MLIKRSLGFALMLYLSAFVLFFLVSLPFGVDLEIYNVSLKSYLVYWLLYIPIILLLAKWYFKKDPPSAQKGLYLGLITIAISFLLDGLSILGALAVGESVEVFAAMYSDWKFYVTVLWVILLCLYAGWEFDRTYTKREGPARRSVGKK